MITFITFPATMGLVLLNRPIVQVLFQYGKFSTDSTQTTSTCLLYFALGIPLISGVKVLTPAFYSLKDTRTPVIVAFFITFFYIASALLFRGPLRVAGIALAMSVTALINFSCLWVLLERKIGRIPKKALGLFAAKTAVLTLLMGLCIRIFFFSFRFGEATRIEQIGILTAAVLIGVVVYLALSLRFSREEVLGLKRILIKKPPRREG